MTINIRDDAVESDVGAGLTVNFDMSTIVASVKGGTALVGSRVHVQIRVGAACELRVLYAVNGPDAAVLTFVDRGTVDKLTKNAEFRAILAATGTNIRLAITNITSGTASIAVYTALL